MTTHAQHSDPESIRAALGKTTSPDTPEAGYNVTSGEYVRPMGAPAFNPANRRALEITPKAREELGYSYVTDPETKRGRWVSTEEQSELARTRRYLAIASQALRETSEELRSVTAQLNDTERENLDLRVACEAMRATCERYGFIEQYAREVRPNQMGGWLVRFAVGSFGYVCEGKTLDAAVDEGREVVRVGEN